MGGRPSRLQRLWSVAIWCSLGGAAWELDTFGGLEGSQVCGCLGWWRSHAKTRRGAKCWLLCGWSNHGIASLFLWSWAEVLVIVVIILFSVVADLVAHLSWEAKLDNQGLAVANWFCDPAARGDDEAA